MSTEPGVLAGRSAVVFGSATGIGAASAQALAAAGAKLVLADIAVDRVTATAERISADGLEAVAYACDVAHEAQVADAIRYAVERHGRLDIVHNNAAAMNLVPHDVAVADADTELWDATMQIDLRGCMFGCKHAVRAMREHGGCIVNTSSASGLIGDVASSAYGTAKAGIVQLTRTVATQYGRDLIRCNAVIPGLIDVNRAAGTGMNPKQRAHLAEHQVLPVAGKPEDVANAVVFLASDQARFITGASLVIDGGLSIHMPTYADGVRGLFD